MKRKVAEIILILLFYLIQVTFGNAIGIGGITPNLLIILPVLFGFFKGRNEAVDDMGAGVARHGADKYGQPRGQNFPLVSGGVFQHALGVLSHSRSPPPASADSSPTG